MPKTIFTNREEVELAIREAANIILENASGLAKDFEERHISGLNILLSADTGEAPTLEISKIYYVFPKKVQ
jgi:hypothetical protein